MDWPSAVPLTALEMADLIDAFARREAVVAVGIDGPQGWRDPGAPPDQGAGRQCEREAVCQGKTGVHGVFMPGTQLRWAQFSIELFDRLLARPSVHLLNCTDPNEPIRLEADGYFVLECYPTSTWRSSGLKPLPGKSQQPDTRAYALNLARGFGLPDSALTDHHDNLQAIVAALSAAAAVGGPARALPRGKPASQQPATADVPSHRIEGLIWDALPLTTTETPAESPPTETLLETLAAGPLYPFRHWPNHAVPPIAAGVYTVWEGEQLLYVGMAGRSLTEESIQAGRSGTRASTGLYSRLASHASGRRSGDQFCVYVADRLVLPGLTATQIAAIGNGELSLDAMVAAHVRDRLGYRFVETASGAVAREIERAIQQGALAAGKPALNPRAAGDG